MTKQHTAEPDSSWILYAALTSAGAGLLVGSAILSVLVFGAFATVFVGARFD